MNRSIRFSTLLFVLPFLVAVQPAHAATTYAWDGLGDGVTWSDPANWNPDGTPVAGDAITVANASTTADINTGVLGGNLSITGSGYATTVTGILDTNTNFNADGNSTMSIENGAKVGFKNQSFLKNGYDVTIKNGGVYWASDNHASINVQSGSTVTLENGATMDSGNFYLIMDGANTVVTMNGANSLIRNGGTTTTSISNGARLVVNDGYYNGNNQTKVFQIAVGTLEINGGQFDTQNLFVNADAGGRTAVGTGSAKITGGDVNMISGNLYVGSATANKIGILEIVGGTATIDCVAYTQLASGTLKVRIDGPGTGLSPINATGAAGVNGLLDVGFVGAAVHGTWTVLVGSSITDNGLAFAPGVDTDFSDGTGWTKAINGGTTLTVTHTPEPATMALLALGGIGLLLGRKRK